MHLLLEKEGLLFILGEYSTHSYRASVRMSLGLPYLVMNAVGHVLFKSWFQHEETEGKRVTVTCPRTVGGRERAETQILWFRVWSSFTKAELLLACPDSRTEL